MITIIFEAHGTTFDNEAHKASGWQDVDLSPLGIKQQKEMRVRYAKKHVDAIFCSDLQRAYKSAIIAFEGRFVPIIVDRRLRECNYGTMDGLPKEQVDTEKPNRIKTPFPKGESYEQASKRMKSFLRDIQKKCEGETILIIGHRATQYGLEHHILRKPLFECVRAPWKWQPGWTYKLG